MRRFFIIFSLFFSLLFGVTKKDMIYVACVIDKADLKTKRDIHSTYALITRMLIRYKNHFNYKAYKNQIGVFELYDVRTGKVLLSIKKQKHMPSFSMIKKVLKNYMKEQTPSKINLAETLYNIRLNSIFKFYDRVEIYFINSLVKSDVNFGFNQRIGYPNVVCLKEKKPFENNYKFPVYHKHNVYVWNRENRFTEQYIYYFYHLFNNLNLKLREYRESASLLESNDVSLLPIKLTIQNLVTMSNKCKLEDGTVPITSQITDKVEISEPAPGKVLLKGYNPNRRNSIVEIKFNNKVFYVKADNNGYYGKQFDLVPGELNTIYIKMLNNKYEKKYSKIYNADVEDSITCKIVGNTIVIKGYNKYRKVGAVIDIKVNGEYTSAVVKNDFSYKAVVPLKNKITQIFIKQLDNSNYECVVRANIKAKDDIYHFVSKMMTADICLSNPDRREGSYVKYKYLNKSNRYMSAKLEKRHGRLCFKVPLKYTTRTTRHEFVIKQLDGTDKTYSIDIDRLPTNIVRIKIEFNCNSDVDLHILEPKRNSNCKKTNDKMCRGREIYYLNTKNYGELDVDSQQASQGPENYVLDITTAPKGRYYYWINWYSRAKYFDRFYNKTCHVRLEILNHGQVIVQSKPFMAVPNVSNASKRRAYSNIPAVDFKNFNSIKQKAYYFDVY